jgi:biopolymer transport protein ExbD
MGFSTGGGRGQVKNEINVTPLVDIVLVLLIVFLVTTPIMMRQITIEVPRKLQADESPKTSKQISVLVKADGNVLINDGAEEKIYPRVEMANRLRDMMKDRVTEKVIFVDFEDKLPYGEVVAAMDTAKGVMGKDDSVVALKIRDEKDAAKAAGDGGETPPTE